MKWTKAWRKTHGKELMYDNTLEFEKKREEPIKYNRDIYVKTVQSMARIEEIKKQREKRHHNARIKEAKKRNVEQVDRILTDKAQYIKNKDVADKYKTRQKAKMAKKLEDIEKTKTKLQMELVGDDNDDDNDEEEESDSGSGMEEEDMDMDDVKA